MYVAGWRYEYLRDENIPVGLIETGVQRENIEQNGINDMVLYLDYKAVRTFSLVEYLQLRYKFYNYADMYLALNNILNLFSFNLILKYR